jgi:hypothetical protein
VGVVEEAERIEAENVAPSEGAGGAGGKEA